MTENYRNNYYGSILDPLHGDIKLSEIEKWCISQPIFSRLRKIKQNTFLYYVFPSANHTRFEHSIGVMHLAGRIFDACKENFATGSQKKEKYFIGKASSFFDLNNLGEKEEVYYQELRLAALLHDVGHGPLSHLFDDFAISKGSFLKIIENSQVLKNYKDGFLSIIGKKDTVEHEVISCAFIFILIDQLKRYLLEYPSSFSDSANRILDSISAERIVKLVEPNFPNLPDFVDSNNDNYTNFFSRIITAFPIDADRMDYLWRDSYFSGVTYGIYDINRIFSSFLPYLDNKVVSLTYKESGLDSMLRFIQSRSHLYNQVYFHKTNRAANTMLSYSTATSKLAGFKLLDECLDIENLIDFYVKNSDELFLQNTVKESISVTEKEKEVLEELINRKLFKRVFQYKIILTEKPYQEFLRQIKLIKVNIDTKLGELEEENVFAISDLYQNETYKDSDEKAILVAKKGGENYQFLNDWQSVGKEFSMADMNVIMIRIYLRRNFKDSIEFEAHKKAVLETVRTEISELTVLGEKKIN